MKCLFSLLISLCIFINSAVNATSEVSLHDKIGQMLLIGFDGKKVNAQSPIIKTIEKNNIGGVILFDYDYHTKTYDRNIESPEQVKQLNGDLQHFTLQGNLKYHRPNLPLLISVDYEGGKVNRLAEQYGFPQTISAAGVGTRSFLEAESIAESMAQTLHDEVVKQMHTPS